MTDTLTRKPSSAKVQDPSPEALATMRERGGTWAAYENHELGSGMLGDVRFLRYGEGCTFREAPTSYPDTSLGTGWRYVRIGFVNMKTGRVVRTEGEAST